MGQLFNIIKLVGMRDTSYRTARHTYSTTSHHLGHLLGLEWRRDPLIVEFEGTLGDSFVTIPVSENSSVPTISRIG